MFNRNEVQWFPMRVTYSREMETKEVLDHLHIENYVPMEYKIEYINKERQRNLRPAIHNLIFVYTSYNMLLGLKKSNVVLSRLRYMMQYKSFLDKNAEKIPLVISAKEMANFITATRDHEHEIRYLKCNSFVLNSGTPVKIIAGPFAGVEGKAVRIHKNKTIVVRLNDFCAVELAYVPVNYLAKMEA